MRRIFLVQKMPHLPLAKQLQARERSLVTVMAMDRLVVGHMKCIVSGSI